MLKAMLNVASDSSVISEIACERALSVGEPAHVPLKELVVAPQFSDAVVPVGSSVVPGRAAM
jgi:hypothetical protein